MLDLDAIQARVNKATSGPWVQDQDPDGDESGITGWLPSRDIKEVYRLPNGDVDIEDLMSAATPADAEFIAHAREDVPALVAELRAARLDNEYRQDRLDLANEVIDAYREYGSGAMPMVDAALQRYDATAEGGS